jgi:maltose-6'-phosphate glucosidase
VQALTLNRTVISPVKAKAILEDMMEVNRPYWPTLK